MHVPLGVAMIAATIAIQIAFSGAHAQVSGAIQYPPAELGEDVQPPPPARMVPQVVSPRRIELGVSGSSQPPTNYPYRVHPPIDQLPARTAPPPGARAMPPPTAGGK
jgi:hypothetical protein